MGNWFKRNLWGLVVGLAMGSLATAVVISNAADSLYGQSASPSASVLDGRYSAAKSETQLALFAASQKACDDIKSIGAKFTFSNGNYELLVGGKDTAGNPEILFANFDSSGNPKSTGSLDYAPQPCLPADLNEQVRRGNTNLAVEFVVDEMGGGVFVWHGHRGSAELSNVYLATGTTVTSFTDRMPQFPETADAVSIDYGLTADQLALVRK